MDTTSTGSTARALRRPAFIAVTAVVALVALVLVAMGRDGGPPVVRLGSAATGGEAAATQAMADDMEMGRAFAVDHEFVLRDSARFPAGEAPGWRLEAPADLQAATSELAGRLGLDAQAASSPYGDGSWYVGATDGSAPSLWVGPSADWSFSDPAAMVTFGCPDRPMQVEPLPADPDQSTSSDATTSDGATGSGASSSDGATSSGEGRAGSADGSAPDEVEDLPDAPDEDGWVDEPCEPDPPVGVPDEAEARRAAETFFAQLMSPTPTIVDVYADEWGAWVTATLPLGSTQSDVHLSVGFGAQSAVASANGTLARPIELDPYPTIDAGAAVARLEDQHAWRGDGMEMFIDPPMPEAGEDAAQPRPADGDAVHDDGDVLYDAGDAQVTDDAGDGDVTHDAGDDGELTSLPAPDPQGEPETVTVTLVSAEPIAMLVIDMDETFWLLPGVRFTDDEGGTWQVLTVADEYLDTDDGGSDAGEPAPEPGVIDPGEGGGEPGFEGSGEPAPAPEPIPAPEDPDTAAAQAVADDVVGDDEATAVAKIEDRGMVARIVSRDGEHLAVTDDYRTDRINLHVEDGVVVEAFVG